jgi:hypothetical protein
LENPKIDFPHCADVGTVVFNILHFVLKASQIYEEPQVLSLNIPLSFSENLGCKKSKIDLLMFYV